MWSTIKTRVLARGFARVPAAEAVVIPLGAILATMVPFGLFVMFAGANPFKVFAAMFEGSFGSWFSLQNTLQRSAPLMLTALCVALPAHLGMVIIGGEGALVIGGLAAATVPYLWPTAPPMLMLPAMALAGAVAGGAVITLAGGLRYYRGVNETISSLLLNYIAIAIFSFLVEGLLRDPASLNKPSTRQIGEAFMLGTIPGMDVHYGLIYGLIACIVLYIFIEHTTIGFAARISGGSLRAARVAGLSVGTLTLGVCFLAGASAGLAGMVEVAAVHGAANASLVTGYGYAGIIVAFIARQNPLAVVPVAILLGGIGASSGLIQRRVGLPDATVLVLQGMLFIVILASESFYGRFKWLQRGPAAGEVVAVKAATPSSPPSGPVQVVQPVPTDAVDPAVSLPANVEQANA